MSTASEIAALAREILGELEVARAAGTDLGRISRLIGVRLRMLLTMTDPTAGLMQEARLTILTAIGRTEIGDQIRRSGGCHTGAERAVELPGDTNLALLAEGLGRLGEGANEGNCSG